MGDFYNDVGKLLSPTLQGVVIWAITVITLKLSNRKKSKPIDVSATYEGNWQINVALELAMEKLGPGVMRVYYTKLHNGDYYDDGSSIQKKSRVAEVQRNGVAPLEDRYCVNILVSKAMDQMKLILESGPSYTFIQDMPRGYYRYHCERGGAQAVALEGVYRGKRFPQNLIGFVGVDFDGDSIMRRPTRPDNIDEVTKLAQRITEINNGENYK